MPQRQRERPTSGPASTSERTAANQAKAMPRQPQISTTAGKLKDIFLPTALLTGATKAEAAATRRAKRKKERILTNFILTSCASMVEKGLASILSRAIQVIQRVSRRLACVRRVFEACVDSVICMIHTIPICI